MNSYGDALKEKYKMILNVAMIAAKLDVKKVAEKTGLNRDTVRNLIKTERYEPQADTVNRVCEAIGISVDRVLKEEARVGL